MAQDIKLIPPMDTELNGRGDLASIDGVDQRIQHAWLRAMNVTLDWRGEAVTPERVEDFRSAVEQALADDPVVDAPVSVAVADTVGSTLILDVFVGRDQFTVEL